MNQKLAKALRRAAGVKFHPKELNAKWGGNARTGNRILAQRVVPIDPLVEGYFWKPRTPIGDDGMRHVRMPVTCRGARAMYRRFKAQYRAQKELDAQSVF